MQRSLGLPGGGAWTAFAGAAQVGAVAVRAALVFDRDVEREPPQQDVDDVVGDGHVGGGVLAVAGRGGGHGVVSRVAGIRAAVDASSAVRVCRGAGCRVAAHRSTLDFRSGSSRAGHGPWLLDGVAAADALAMSVPSAGDRDGSISTTPLACGR
ncbi:hypothetical protein [Dactylosporangium sp. NPDC049140]|uniref:hypothetical protein n=1 Tax=Dactylosporangium sp. NPDC049140 TaxID=3155647 RepID=UPI0033D74038